MRGLILSAPSSASGKTLITLGILRALRRRGVAAGSAKSGPDYIDPRFHEAASGQPCVNLDAWAMTPARLRALAAGPAQTAGMLIVEGAMGLFDGAPPDGGGSTAHLARILGLPVVLVVDGSRMAQSVGPVVAGLARHEPAVRVVGVILNRVGSERHARLLRNAVAAEGVPVLGVVPRHPSLVQPSRHLGLVQAQERPDLDRFIDGAADLVGAHVDLDALLRLAKTTVPGGASPVRRPPAQRIAVARDDAFSFAYPHLLAEWRASGATLSHFSPLADEAVPECDLVILPGGYPELHAGRVAAATVFNSSLRRASQETDIHAECGGYMVLGQGLVDAGGTRHAMAGLLDLETSFAARRLHLGYRIVEADAGAFAGRWAAHEFHHSTVLRETGTPLFRAWDAEGDSLAPMGLRSGRVSGSFAHLIEPVDGHHAVSGVAVTP